MLFGFFPFVGGLGLPELMIFGVIVLLVFGKRLPTLMRSMGQSIVEFKKGASDVDPDGSSDNDNDRKDS